MGLIVIGYASHVTSRIDLCSAMDVHVSKGDILFVLARTSLDASMILFSDCMFHLRNHVRMAFMELLMPDVIIVDEQCGKQKTRTKK
jgi:hypothetical protein